MGPGVKMRGGASHFDVSEDFVSVRVDFSGCNSTDLVDWWKGQWKPMLRVGANLA